MAWTNAAQLQQGIERMEVTQLVLEHSLQRAHASRMKNPRDSDLASIDPDRSALACVIYAEDLLDSLDNGHSLSCASHHNDRNAPGRTG